MEPLQLDLGGRYAVTIDSILDATTCKNLIDLAEASGGYRHATINANGQQIACKEIRDCQRWINDDETLSDILFQKVREHLPKTWGLRKLSRLNNQLKFIKYDPGNYFKPHFDGEYTTADGNETSFITVQFYLNEGFKGGETTFLRYTGFERKKLEAVVPKIGKVLMFEHEILHEGSKVLSGCKYVIRTDVMYK